MLALLPQRHPLGLDAGGEPVNATAATILALLAGLGIGYAGHAYDEHREQQACISHGHGWGYIADVSTETKGDGAEVCVVYERSE